MPVTTSSGIAIAELCVLADPADPGVRGPDSRRIVAGRPDSSGRVIIDNRPPGDYLLAALTDIEEGDWNAPAFFEPLVPASVRLTLGDGEKRVQDLQVGG